MGKMQNRILVVEDSQDTRDAIADCLEMAGYSVTQAGDGMEALVRAREARPDLVLLDINLPLLDGYDVATLWKNDAQMSRVPVIALSGRSGSEHERRAIDAGCLLALCKPLQPEMMLAAVRGALL